MPLTKFQYWTTSGRFRPSRISTSWIAWGPALLPTYRDARSVLLAPISLGTRKKIAKVTMLTMMSRTIAASSRRMRKLTTVPGCGGRRAGSPPAVHRCLHLPSMNGSSRRLLHTHLCVVEVTVETLADKCVLHRRRPVHQVFLGQERHDVRVVHHLGVDLGPDGTAGGVVGGRGGLVDQLVDGRILHAEVGVARGPDDAAVDDLLEVPEALRPVGAPRHHHEAEAVLLHILRVSGVQLEVVVRGVLLV